MEELVEMFKDKKISFQEILLSLLDEEDLEMKTEIHDPLGLTALKILQEYLEKCELSKSAKLIDIFTEYFLKYMVSYKRKSRAEIIEAISKSMSLELKEEKVGNPLYSNLAR